MCTRFYAVVTVAYEIYSKFYGRVPVRVVSSGRCVVKFFEFDFLRAEPFRAQLLGPP